MIQHLRYLFKVFLFWLVLFNLARTIFILYFHGSFAAYGADDILSVYRHAFPLDVSTCMYVLLLPFVFSCLALYTQNRKWFRRFNAAYHYILLFFFSVIVAGDLGIYSAWGTKLNHRAISFLAFPGEAIASMGSSPLFTLSLIVLLVFVAGIILYRLLFRSDLFLQPTENKDLSPSALYAPPRWYLLPFLVAAYAFIAVVCLRGGLQLIPINESAAYFSEHAELNHAAVNTTWFMVHSVFENRWHQKENPYQYFTDDAAAAIVKDLLTPPRDSTTQILSTKRPNVVFIMLESFTADVVEDLGGVQGVTPTLHSLIQNGVLFSNVYASGARTDQGLVSVLSAFPAQPLTSIIRQTDKIERLPSITEALMNNGYSSSFYYGGELGFGNMKAFVLHNGFQHYTSIDDYAPEMMSNKWGAHDNFVLERQLKELPDQQEPFFSFLLTLSSHEPYVVPMPAKFDDGTEASHFINSCYYTDLSLGKYFDEAKKQPWYANTLFVLCADHGHPLPRNRAYNEPKRHHVPLIMFGDVIKPEYRGMRIDAPGSQIDIASTLLHLLQMDVSQFNWSDNLLNPYRSPFSFYSFDEGAGLVYSDGSVSYDCRSQLSTWWYGTSPGDTVRVNQCKAYLQEMFKEYLRY